MQKKRTRKRFASGRPRPVAAAAANHVWAYDFVADNCANGQQLKCLTVIDEWTNECLAIDVQCSIRSARVIEVLSQLVSTHGAPAHLRSDDGPKFVSRAVPKCLSYAGINTARNDPRKPWQNGADESFNGKFCDECLNTEWFRNHVEAKVVIEQWRELYKHDRPHSSLGYQSSLAFKKRADQNRLKEKQPSPTTGIILN